LFDAGGGSYERSKWRSYDIDTFSHNTVLVDGYPQRRQTRDRWACVSTEPLDVKWQSTDTYDFAVGSYNDAYGKEENKPVTHIRRVLFMKPDIFLVADNITPIDDDIYEYQARWHLITTATKLDENTNTVITTDPELSNLAIVPLMVDGLIVQKVSAQTEPELLGWYVQKDKVNRPATTVTHTIEDAGTKHFLTMLLPIKPGLDNPIQAVKSIGLKDSEVIMKDGRRIILSVDTDPGGSIEIHEIMPDGKPGRNISVILK
ncbi:heparinase, partial [Candidatus Poribacteria bacterium]|nr:heparinase [Candidatus Poribacteria bacterium]